jgi:hypothetical protein
MICKDVVTLCTVGLTSTINTGVLNYPAGIVLASSGDIYTTERGNSVIRRYSESTSGKQCTYRCTLLD